MPNPGSNPLSHLVVVGSSAGGIEALSTLVSTLPSPPAVFPAAIVIAQHLDPTRMSHLGEILARRSPLSVVSVQDQEKLVPGTVYVVPSNHHVQITDRDIALLPDVAGRPKPSIDLLLTSASEVYGERLIAVVLTGTGSDGSAGALAVKQAGGTVIIQDPDTAAYPGMPESLDPRIVDIVADIRRIGPIISDLVNGVAVPSQHHAMRELKPVLDRLRTKVGVDFRSYKPPTIMRRLQRRIIATESGDLAGYVKYLEAHPEEYQPLVNSFLIKVTEFFRDPELFDVLREQVLPALIASCRHRSGNNSSELRIWSAGCATGEEAYSLAILVYELLGDDLPDFRVKIFATDLDAEAIKFARRGVYSAGALASLPDTLVGRYFTRSSINHANNAKSANRAGSSDGSDGSSGSMNKSRNATYEVKKKLRGMVVFGEHDLSERPPFPRIDLVLCRNVLIYFDKELQQHALQLFAFALRDGGYLVLGKTETVGSLAGLFTLENKGGKIYRRTSGTRAALPIPIANLAVGGQERERQTGQGSHRLAARELFQSQQETVRIRTSNNNLLRNLPVGVVVVDERYDIQEINSAARRLLGIFGKALGEDLVHLVQHVPHGHLRKAIDRSLQQNTVSSLNDVPIPHPSQDATNYIQITCYPQVSTEEGEEDRPAPLALILITDVTQQVHSRRESEQAHSAQVALSAELARSNTDLKAANAASATNIEELRHTVALLEQARLQAEEIAKQHEQQAEEIRGQHAQHVKRLAESTGELFSANEALTRLNNDLSTKCDDFLATNEEAQAAIEEAETLNEEMQASNEELETLNEELQATIEELHTSNSDLVARGEELEKLAASLEAQRQLSEREKIQLEVILAGMTDAVLVVTADGKPLLTNAAYEQLFANGMDSNRGGNNGNNGNNGSDGVESVGRVVMSDNTGMPLPVDVTPWARAARSETFAMTFTFMAADGKPRWCEAIGKPVIGDDSGRLGVVVIRDITERSLRQLQEQFMALANHELRTPLTSVLGYLQIFATWLKSQPGSDRQLRNVTIALAQARRLTGLIDDLLDVTRLQTGKFQLRLAPVELYTLLQETVEVGQVLSKNQKIELDSVGDPIVVNGDAERLQQTLLNLLTNARTHAPSSARVDVRLRRVGNLAEIEVQDYGKGIEAKNLPDLFSRFFQVLQGAPAPGQGLGLGLFISQQIVEAHSGTITVDSTVGKGTTFTIRLPLLQQNT